MNCLFDFLSALRDCKAHHFGQDYLINKLVYSGFTEAP